MSNFINNIGRYLIPASLISLIPFVAFASGNLQANDFVGMSFWIISIGMVAATVFFFIESMKVDAKWRTSLVVAGLVTMIAAIHYFYMRGYYISTGDSPTVFRYVDWILTVPLQIIEFYLILAAITIVSVSLFWRLLIASLVMLVAGYLGEVNSGSSSMLWILFIIGLVSLYTFSKKFFYLTGILTITLFLVENIKINPYQYVWFNLPSRYIDLTNNDLGHIY